MRALRKIILSALFIILIVTSQATAGTLTYEFDYMFSGKTPDGPMPWITAVFDDSYGGENNVRLKMSANNLTNKQFVSDWYFNFDPVKDPSGLSFAFVESSGVFGDVTYDTGSLKADGDGWYDIKFDMPQGNNNSNRFDNNDSITYDIAYSSAIDVSSFNYLSEPGGNAGTYVSAAQISANSTWIAPSSVVPEPIGSVLFIAGGVTIGFMCFRNKRKKQV